MLLTYPLEISVVGAVHRVGGHTHDDVVGEQTLNVIDQCRCCGRRPVSVVVGVPRRRAGGQVDDRDEEATPSVSRRARCVDDSRPAHLDMTTPSGAVVMAPRLQTDRADCNIARGIFWCESHSQMKKTG